MDSKDSQNIYNIDFIEGQYRIYLQNPQKLDPSWRYFFQGYDLSSDMPAKGEDPRLFLMIDSLRRKGHMRASFNPLKPDQNAYSIEEFGFSSTDLSTIVTIEDQQKSIKEVFDFFNGLYCHKIGFEFMHIENEEVLFFIQDEIEKEHKSDVTKQEYVRILEDLNRSEIFETFLHHKFMGQKRFSLEGAETLIPVLDALIQEAGKNGTEEIVLGMAHRGRLNVLTNILNKPYGEIFSEFDPNFIPKDSKGSGDAKYHKGYSCDYLTESGKSVHIHLTANPSHLESVDSVVLGQTKAKQFIKNDEKKVLPLLIHGDAAIAGQGVVYECMQLSKIEGYSTGGCVHLVINNQIGFTTNPHESRSTRYCTDIAKPFGAPIFHVSVEDPINCIYVTKLAIQIRQKFGIDVFIDLIGYRKYGHNEGDEPAFTQPAQYEDIRNRKPIRQVFFNSLIEGKLVEKELLESLEKEFKENLQKALEEKNDEKSLPDTKREQKPTQVETKVSKETLLEITKATLHVPEGFVIFPKLEKSFEQKDQIITGGKEIDWAFAEQLAFGSLLLDDKLIRLSGQDSQRGTFNHRHAAWTDQKTEKRYFPLQHLGKGHFEVYNSPLSEYAVLGFDYGYSLSNEKALVIWEAQYGDFCNTAQVIIDQYITSSEQKWDRFSSICLLLPHGYEGAGPEHSSARMERFLRLAGEDNIQIAYPSTPGQYFHLLREQGLNTEKKPLIVFTPKSLLRNPLCKSPVSELEEGQFCDIIEDNLDPKEIKRVLFCTGKIFYELYEKRGDRKDIAIVRIEKLYPFPEEKITQVMKNFSKVKEVFWVQEEPENMGAWAFIYPYLKNILTENNDLRYIGRKKSGSPATGFSSVHKATQQAIIDKALEN